MKRRSYKYLFIFNFAFIVSVAGAVLFMHNEALENNARASITTSLLYPEIFEADFCTSAKAAVIVDAKSSAAVYRKNDTARLPMASTTKIMTALVVIENADPELVVTVSDNAAKTAGSSIYLTSGEKITVRTLLYGLLLESGNDAATALAEGVFGTVGACVEKMNERARQIGLVDTHFANPHGLDDENHYTTAYELALITREAMKNSLFREMVKTQSYVSKGEKTRYFSNHNKLLYSFPYAVGVKTGYTSHSGRCLVSCAERDNEEYIAVTLCDRDDWNDHKKMLCFAFDNFDTFEIADKDSFCVSFGFARYHAPESTYLTAVSESEFLLTYKFRIKDNEALAEYYAEDTKLGSFFLQKAL